MLLRRRWSICGRICTLIVPDEDFAKLFQTGKVRGTPCVRVSEVVSGEEVALRRDGKLTTPGYKTAGGGVKCRNPGERVRSDRKAAVVMRFLQAVGDPVAIRLAPPRPEVRMTLLATSPSIHEDPRETLISVAVGRWALSER